MIPIGTLSRESSFALYAATAASAASFASPAPTVGGTAMRP